MNSKLKKYAVGFGIFFVMFVAARLLDAKLGVTNKVAALIPGMTPKS